MTTLTIEERADGVRFRVRARPRASRSGIAGIHDGALRIRIAAPPVDDEANAELIRFLARALGIAKSAVRITAGRSSRSKTVEADGVTAAAVRRLLDAPD
jgi:uncharacterized protein (TIGR00251 family)